MNDYEELVAKYGYIEEYQCGKNEDGENVMVSIDKDCACIRTYQRNGFVRVNIYHNDGTIEELYEH